MWYMHDGFGWWMIFGGVWMVLFWGAIIALIVWGISKFSGRSGDSSRQRALDISRERYARGDISREEFEEMRKDLS